MEQAYAETLTPIEKRPLDALQQETRALVLCRRSKLNTPQRVVLRMLLKEKDGTSCWLCGEQMDFTLPITSPVSVTLDHILPVCLGGSDSIANLRLAHRACNERRGAGDRIEKIVYREVGDLAKRLTKVLRTKMDQPDPYLDYFRTLFHARTKVTVC